MLIHRMQNRIIQIQNHYTLFITQNLPKILLLLHLQSTTRCTICILTPLKKINQRRLLNMLQTILTNMLNHLLMSTYHLWNTQKYFLQMLIIRKSILRIQVLWITQISDFSHHIQFQFLVQSTSQLCVWSNVLVFDNRPFKLALGFLVILIEKINLHFLLQIPYREICHLFLVVKPDSFSALNAVLKSLLIDYWIRKMLAPFKCT